jgi:hypothetical protein
MPNKRLQPNARKPSRGGSAALQGNPLLATVAEALRAGMTMRTGVRSALKRIVLWMVTVTAPVTLLAG